MVCLSPGIISASQHSPYSVRITCCPPLRRFLFFPTKSKHKYPVYGPFHSFLSITLPQQKRASSGGKSLFSTRLIIARRNGAGTVLSLGAPTCYVGPQLAHCGALDRAYTYPNRLPTCSPPQIIYVGIRTRCFAEVFYIRLASNNIWTYRPTCARSSSFRFTFRTPELLHIGVSASPRRSLLVFTGYVTVALDGQTAFSFASPPPFCYSVDLYSSPASAFATTMCCGSNDPLPLRSL